MTLWVKKRMENAQVYSEAHYFFFSTFNISVDNSIETRIT